MMQKDQPCTTVHIAQNCPNPSQLGWVYHANGVGERHIAGGIRIQKDEPVSPSIRCRLNQGKHRIPDFRQLPSAAQRSLLCQAAQQFQTVALTQIVRERWSECARLVIPEMSMIPSNLI